jgi:hypothetical protein
MKNNGNLVKQIKRSLYSFVNKITVNLPRPEVKFVADMVYGIVVSKSVMLSDISRSLGEIISLHKTEERLSRNLAELDDYRDQIHENYLNTIKSNIDTSTIFCIDPGEICKRYSKEQEGLGKVYDASQKKGSKGWKLYSVVALTHGSKIPIPTYMSLVAPDEDDQTTEILNAIKATQNSFMNNGIETMDRGMDNNAVFTHLTNSKSSFVIRLNTTRNLALSNGDIQSALEIANSMEGRYLFPYFDKKGRKTNLKVNYKNVVLPFDTETKLSVIVVYGYDDTPMILLTNMPVTDKNSCISIVKIYCCRWRIEELYRFIKVKFNLENIRVLSLSSMTSMVTLVEVVAGYIAMLASKRGESMMVEGILENAKHLKEVPNFCLYALADGISNILAKSTSSLDTYFGPTKKDKVQQLTLMNDNELQASLAF